MSSERKKPLLPGVGRPLNYIPDATDPDYVGELFKNALSMNDLDVYEERRGPTWYFSKEPKSDGQRVPYVVSHHPLATDGHFVLTPCFLFFVSCETTARRH